MWYIRFTSSIIILNSSLMGVKNNLCTWFIYFLLTFLNQKNYYLFQYYKKNKIYLELLFLTIPIITLIILLVIILFFFYDVIYIYIITFNMKLEVYHLVDWNNLYTWFILLTFLNKKNYYLF